jgi:hypothetical protein
MRTEDTINVGQSASTVPARRRIPRATLTVSLPVEGNSQDTRFATITVQRFSDELVQAGLLAEEPVKGAYRWQGGKGKQPRRLVATLTLAGYKHLLALLTGDNNSK